AARLPHRRPGSALLRRGAEHRRRRIRRQRCGERPPAWGPRAALAQSALFARARLTAAQRRHFETPRSDVGADSVRPSRDATRAPPPNDSARFAIQSQSYGFERRLRDNVAQAGKMDAQEQTLRRRVRAERGWSSLWALMLCWAVFRAPWALWSGPRPPQNIPQNSSTTLTVPERDHAELPVT